MTKIVLVATSAPDLNGLATGLWIEELATPYYLFLGKGYEVTVASPSGGPIPIDQNSVTEAFFTEDGKKFLHDAEAVGKLSHSVKLASIDFSDAGGVDAIYLTGGHGTCVDFIDNPTLKAALETMYNTRGKVIAADCHGVIGFCPCVQSDGKTPLVAGKKVAGFTDAEEEAVQAVDKVPFLLESRLVEQGAKFEKADNWVSKVCVDGTMVTGQNPQSSKACAEAVIAVLSL